ncbi:MAG TPA: hypothetical protein VG406_26340 [Isosphaeraceae bacterium]|jgi:hypothetical protein|nr:hypothetical protein [Isosphaeraceae bacterium]
MGGTPERPARPRSKKDIQARDAEARRYGLRNLVKVFVAQQSADREMRSGYARILVRILIVQLVAINLFVLLLGFGRRLGFHLDEWTARTLILAVFLEIAALVHAVAKYLFPRPSDRFLEIMERLHSERGQARRRRR